MEAAAGLQAKDPENGKKIRSISAKYAPELHLKCGYNLTYKKYTTLRLESQAKGKENKGF